MTATEMSVRSIQDECAQIAIELEQVAYRLVKLRESLRLPTDTNALYEEEDIPWPVEVEVDSALGAAIDDSLGPAAEKLRKASRVTAEQLRQKILVRQMAKRRIAAAVIEAAD